VACSAPRLGVALVASGCSPAPVAPQQLGLLVMALILASCWGTLSMGALCLQQ